MFFGEPANSVLRNDMTTDAGISSEGEGIVVIFAIDDELISRGMDGIALLDETHGVTKRIEKQIISKNIGLIFFDICMILYYSVLILR